MPLKKLLPRVTQNHDHCMEGVSFVSGNGQHLCCLMEFLALIKQKTKPLPIRKF